MNKELAVKAVIYTVLVVIAAVVAMSTADCHDLTRIVYDKGNSVSGQQARFYFLTLLGLGVIMVQNLFIRLALFRVQQDNEPPEEKAPELGSK